MSEASTPRSAARSRSIGHAQLGLVQAQGSIDVHQARSIHGDLANPFAVIIERDQVRAADREIDVIGRGALVEGLEVTARGREGR